MLWAKKKGTRTHKNQMIQRPHPIESKPQTHFCVANSSPPKHTRSSVLCPYVFHFRFFFFTRQHTTNRKLHNWFSDCTHNLPLKMAMFTPSPRGADNFACFHSHSQKPSLSPPRTTPLLFFNNKLHHSQLHSFPSLKFRVLCSIKEKENIKETEKVTTGVLTGLRVNDLDQSGSGPEESGSGKVGSDWDWPPWQNIPERYKLIGTTSLAFVICNMDKVL